MKGAGWVTGTNERIKHRKYVQLSASLPTRLKLNALNSPYSYFRVSMGMSLA